MLLQILFLAIGLFLLIKGAGLLVDGSSMLARKLKIPDLVIGLTIVAFGTSAPELVVNIIASTQNHPDIVFGNIIGSNNFNLFIILGIAGLISPIIVQSNSVWKEIPLSLLAVVVLFLLATNFISSEPSILSRTDGLVLLSLFGIFLFYIFKQLKTDSTEPQLKTPDTSFIKTWGFIIIGMAGLVFGGKLVINNAVKIATSLAVSEKVIGLTLIAAGTSLPELATSVIAAIKKNNDIAVGNVIGSNIFNILLILSVSTFIKPLSYSINFNTDIYILFGGTLFLFIAMFTGQKKKLDRWEATVLLISYTIYTFYLIRNTI